MQQITEYIYILILINMPRWKKNLPVIPAELPKTDFVPSPVVVQTTTNVVSDIQKLSAKEPTALEKAMEMLMLSQANTNIVLNKISETMTTVAEGIQKINDTSKASIDHQMDLDGLNKSKPFKIQMLYQLDQRTIDLGDGIFEYESTWRAFKTRWEAVEFGNKNFWQQGFRIIEVEQPVSQT